MDNTDSKSALKFYTKTEMAVEKSLINSIKKIPIKKNRLQTSTKLSKIQIEQRLNYYCRSVIDSTTKKNNALYRGVSFDSYEKLRLFVSKLKNVQSKGNISKLLKLDLFFLSASKGVAEMFAVGKYGVVTVYNAKKIDYFHTYCVEEDYAMEDSTFIRKHTKILKDQFTYGDPITYTEIRTGKLPPSAIRAIIIYVNGLPKLRYDNVRSTKTLHNDLFYSGLEKKRNI